jgi:hypothetical protein
MTTKRRPCALDACRYGRGKIEYVPIGRQMTCGSPGRTSCPYSKRGSTIRRPGHLPDAGMSLDALDPKRGREPLPSPARQVMNCATALRNARCCWGVRRSTISCSSALVTTQIVAGRACSLTPENRRLIEERLAAGESPGGVAVTSLEPPHAATRHDIPIATTTANERRVVTSRPPMTSADHPCPRPRRSHSSYGRCVSCRWTARGTYRRPPYV